MMRLALVFFTFLFIWSPAAASTVFAAPLSIDVREADVVDVLRLLASEAGENIVLDSSLVRSKVTVHLSNVTFERALATMAHAYDFQVHREGSICIIGSTAVMNRKYGSSPSDGLLGPRTAKIEVRNMAPDDLLKPLQEALTPGTIIVADGRTAALIVTGDAATIQRARRLVAALDAPTRRSAAAAVVSIPLRYTRSIDAAKQLKGVLPDGKYSSDDEHNAIVVAADPRTASIARVFLAALDAPTPQVMFEVRVVDISSDAERRIGVLYGGLGSNGVGTTTYTFQNKSIPIQATLNALIADGQAKVLATPRLATLNNREASLLIGQNYPIEQQTISGGATSVSVTFIDVGVKLRITPTIGADGSITAELHPEFSAISGTDSFGNPIVANRKIDATLRVRRDETIVLGGLLEDVEQNTVTKIPLLGDLPLLGEVFRNHSRSHTKDDVVFLITPHVL